MGSGTCTSILTASSDVVNVKPLRNFDSSQKLIISRAQSVIGVDFSGAAAAGKNSWIAEMSIERDKRLRLRSLASVGKLAGSDERATTIGYLVDRIASSQETLFGFDFPFGLPLELGLGSWTQQLRHVKRFAGDARQYGLSLVELSQTKLGKFHVRRQTDVDSRTPFDCYHYRIIYQTFHGMRDLLAPIAGHPDTAVLPFQYAKASLAHRWVGEACPSSTLKRLSLPSRLYKQTGGEKLADDRRRVRRVILKGLASHVDIPANLRPIVMNNLGGDALDAVIAGVGVWTSCQHVDHHQIARHRRFPREGYVYH